MNSNVGSSGSSEVVHPGLGVLQGSYLEMVFAYVYKLTAYHSETLVVMSHIRRLLEKRGVDFSDVTKIRTLEGCVWKDKRNGHPIILVSGPLFKNKDTSGVIADLIMTFLFELGLEPTVMKDLSRHICRIRTAQAFLDPDDAEILVDIIKMILSGTECAYWDPGTSVATFLN